MIRVGTSGWRYPSWRGRFYPSGLPQRAELTFAGETFDSVEVNGSFYSLQRPASWIRWREETPDDSVFAVKGGRYLTHMLRLRGVEVALGNFFGSGLLALGEKLGPVLWQLPARHEFDAETIDAFLSLLPRTTGEANAAAERHDKKLRHAPVLADRTDLRIRHALEVRHASFASDEAAAVVERHGAALVESDGGDRWPRLRRDTADFVYMRLHGADELYVSGYDGPELQVIAERAHAETTGAIDGVPRDVYIYFDNDANVRAPVDAQELKVRLARLS